MLPKGTTSRMERVYLFFAREGNRIGLGKVEEFLRK